MAKMTMIMTTDVDDDTNDEEDDNYDDDSNYNEKPCSVVCLIGDMPHCLRKKPFNMQKPKLI